MVIVPLWPYPVVVSDCRRFGVAVLTLAVLACRRFDQAPTNLWRPRAKQVQPSAERDEDGHDTQIASDSYVHMTCARTGTKEQVLTGASHLSHSSSPLLQLHGH